MNEEFFDEVDEKDQPTGRKITKQQAHQESLLHRCAAVFVFDEKDRLFVQEHKSSGLLDHSVGGHVNAGEDYLTAAIREADEELGLKNQSLKLIAIGVRSEEFYANTHLKHIFGIYECYPRGWAFEPNIEVEHIYPETIENIVTQMQHQGERFTTGFITTMVAFLKNKKLTYPLDIQTIKNKWTRLEKY